MKLTIRVWSDWDLFMIYDAASGVKLGVRESSSCGFRLRKEIAFSANWTSEGSADDELRRRRGRLTP